MQRKILCLESSCNRSQTGEPFHPADSGSGSTDVEVQAADNARKAVSPVRQLVLPDRFSSIDAIICNRCYRLPVHDV